MKAPYVEFLLPISSTTIDPEHIWVWRRTRPSHAPFSRPKSDRSWQHVRSVDCITAMNDEQPERSRNSRHLVNRSRIGVYSCAHRRRRFCEFVHQASSELFQPPATSGSSWGLIPADAPFGIFVRGRNLESSTGSSSKCPRFHSSGHTPASWRGSNPPAKTACKMSLGSCRRDLLDHVIILNEPHLKRLMSEYVSYYHEDRTHLGLAKDTPAGRPTAIRSAVESNLRSSPRLGGLHHRYAVAA